MNKSPYCWSRIWRSESSDAGSCLGSPCGCSRVVIKAGVVWRLFYVHIWCWAGVSRVAAGWWAVCMSFCPAGASMWMSWASSLLDDLRGAWPVLGDVIKRTWTWIDPPAGLGNQRLLSPSLVLGIYTLPTVPLGRDVSRTQPWESQLVLGPGGLNMWLNQLRALCKHLRCGRWGRRPTHLAAAQDQHPV